MNCKCGSGKKTTAHYFAGKLICFDCPDCFTKNDDEYRKLIQEQNNADN